MAAVPEQGLAAAPAKDAVATILAGGNFHFSLEDSAVKAHVEKKCAASDEPEICLAEIREAAVGEGIEISPIGDDRIRYVSYAHEDGKRIVVIDGDARVLPVEEGIVELLPANIRVGKVPPNVRLLLEVVDEDTIAMDKTPGGHPRSGEMRLVFHLNGG